MREATLGILKADEKSQSKSEESPVTHLSEQKDNNNNIDMKSDSKISKNYNKPAWAMTKEVAGNYYYY